MMRVLFIDDDTNILDGLRRTLRSMRESWHMEFVSSAREALVSNSTVTFSTGSSGKVSTGAMRASTRSPLRSATWRCHGSCTSTSPRGSKSVS